ncbi:MAG TPA: hypothetical protein VHG51_08210, partial [Longimicrobiaceae bacterium]|nr:hypothetical protein [Longimicrobiaceae bacterium]
MKNAHLIALALVSLAACGDVTRPEPARALPDAPLAEAPCPDGRSGPLAGPTSTGPGSASAAGGPACGGQGGLPGLPATPPER